MSKFIAYYRVSTQMQGASGLGLEAQAEAVQRLVKSLSGDLIETFVEVESGRVASRPVLASALAECRKRKATLVVGKLDRLARDVKFFLEVLDSSGVSLRFADFPDSNPNTSEGKMILISMMNFAEFEAKKISERTKAAVAVKKAQGKRVGFATHANPQESLKKACEASKQALKADADSFAESLRDDIMMRRKAGYTINEIAEQWNKMNVKTSRGKQWYPTTVANLLRRLENTDTIARVPRKDKKA